jgi:hypothetical protein
VMGCQADLWHQPAARGRHGAEQRNRAVRQLLSDSIALVIAALSTVLALPIMRFDWGPADTQCVPGRSASVASKRQMRFVLEQHSVYVHRVFMARYAGTEGTIISI